MQLFSVDKWINQDNYYQIDDVCLLFLLHLSFFIPLQWSVSGVFPVSAHFAAATEPHPGYYKR